MALTRQAIAGWRRFLAPYYSASALLIASYALTRQWWLEHGDAKYAHMPPQALAEKVGRAGAGWGRGRPGAGQDLLTHCCSHQPLGLTWH